MAFNYSTAYEDTLAYHQNRLNQMQSRTGDWQNASIAAVDLPMTAEQGYINDPTLQRNVNAERLGNAAYNFRNNLNTYTNPQINAAQESARMNLANDIQGAKSDANARGLLQSGVNAGNQANARAQESGKLAQNIQNINQTANTTADQLDQLTAKAIQAGETQNINTAALQEQAQETSYGQALQEQQQQQSFFGNLIKGIAGIGADVALAL